MRPPKSATQTWLQLLRAPNLFTVPGDPLAGFLIVSGGHIDGRLLAAVLASICFYAHGLLVNDLADLAEDTRERPSRPLPSGAARPVTVRLVAGALAAGGLVCAAAAGWPPFFAGVALLVVILLYNLWAKRIAWLGPVFMGLCRGLSLFIGALAAQAPGASTFALPPLIWCAAGGLTLYIALVTNLARVETHADPPQLPRTLPFISLLVIVVLFFFVALDWYNPLAPFNAALYAVSAYILYAGFKIDRRLTHDPAPPIPPMIGQLIRLLLPLQAIWCIASHSFTGGIAATVLLILWPISRNVSRRFYAS